MSKILDMAIGEYGIKGAGVVFIKFFQPLSTIAEVTEVAFGVNHQKAQIIADTFYMFLGGAISRILIISMVTS